jgi:uncharacterized membrane protein YphA (DoxX/SURF4 family)
MKNFEKYSSHILRYGLALVFIWFGLQQLTDPSLWEGFIPLWIADIVPTRSLVYANGVIEMIGAVMLITGFYVRWAALVLALHLFGIAARIGLNATGVRDFGLAMATLSIALKGK